MTLPVCEERVEDAARIVDGDVTAQDAADLLAYLTTLKSGNQDVRVGAHRFNT